jgi:hypothetical protein
MMGDTMFASGKDAHLSTFNRGSEGNVTDEKSKPSVRRKDIDFDRQTRRGTS